MNMAEAKEELKKLADGKYHCIRYELTEHSGSDGDFDQKCSVYIDVFGWRYGASWREVLDMMINVMAGKDERPLEDLSAINELEK